MQKIKYSSQFYTFILIIKLTKVNYNKKFRKTIYADSV